MDTVDMGKVDMGKAGMDSTDMVLVLVLIKRLLPILLQTETQTQSLDGRTLDPDGHQSQNRIHLNQSPGGQRFFFDHYD
jgi:hypothetical protein